MGDYSSYLCDEVVPWVDAHYRTAPEPGHRGITGKSSGGFGAHITPMPRPGRFGGLASHAGDARYEYCYLPEFAQVVRALREYDGDIQRWWANFRGRTAFSKPTDGILLSALGCSAAFSADTDGRRSCRPTRAAGGCARTCGPAGWPGTRCAWSRTTPTRCAG